MKTNIEVVNDDDCYRDVDVYVADPAGPEWKFRVYLDKENGGIVHSDPMYSPNTEDCFEEAELLAPLAVRQALEAAMPSVYALLKGGE